MADDDIEAPGHRDQLEQPARVPSSPGEDLDAERVGLAGRAQGQDDSLGAIGDGFGQLQREQLRTATLGRRDEVKCPQLRRLAGTSKSGCTCSLEASGPSPCALADDRCQRYRSRGGVATLLHRQKGRRLLMMLPTSNADSCVPNLSPSAGGRVSAGAGSTK